jgi:uncharacterized RDD family membrane protein YckC
MSSVGTQNPFAPPRALVDDQYGAQAQMLPASRGSRLAAIMIDGLGPGVVIVGLLAAVALPAYHNYVQRSKGLPVSDPSFAGGGAVLAILGLALVAFFIYSAVLVYRYGQTFGKRIMGIRVVRTDGSRVTFARFIFLRWLPLAVVGVVPYIGGLIGLIDPLLIFRDSSQCLHDNIADTKVVTAATSEGATLVGSSGAHLRTISF